MIRKAGKLPGVLVSSGEYVTEYSTDETVMRFGAIDASPASPASSSADRVTPTNTLGSARFSHGLLRHPKEPLDCAPDATGAVHCVSPGAVATVEVARAGGDLQRHLE